MQFFKKNIALLIGIAIPIVMIIGIAATIYIPGLFIHPKYNFLYVVGDNQYYGQWYSVENGVLTKHEPTQVLTTPQPTPKLFVYDVTSQKSTPVSEQTATALHLDSSVTSQDGFSVTTGTSGSYFPLFWGGSSDYNSHYLVGQGYSKKINQESTQPYSYNDNFQFLGWITP